MLKHESGWYIADPEGLAAFHNGRNYSDRNSAPFFALVQPSRWRLVPDPNPAMSLPWKFDSSIDDYTYRPWVLCSVVMLSESSLIMVVNECTRDTPLYTEVYTGVPDRSKTFPIEFLKSPARIALEKLGAKLNA